MKQMFALFGVLGATVLMMGSARADSLRWRGDVDDRATVHISARRVWTDADSKGVKNEHSDVRGNLPDRPVRVSLSHVSGRGNIRIVEQPNRRNNFTAVVEIRDRDAGRAHYEFTLDWDSDEGRGGRGRDRDRDRDRDHDRDYNPNYGRGWDR